MLAVMGKFGRLGNQLWTYANVLAYAFEKETKLINVAFEGADLFKGSLGLDKKDCNFAKLILNGFMIKRFVHLIYKINLRTRYYPFVQIGEGGFMNLDEEPQFESVLDGHSIVFLSGFYFSAPTSLAHRKECIKRFFSLLPSLEEKVVKLVSAAKGDGDVLIGVHVRHGDYRTFCKGIMFYTPEEYAKAMLSLKEQFTGQKVSFLICSDEKQDLKRFRGLNVYQSENESVVDMYALSCCDFILGPNSTFSQWASFYGDVPLHVLDWRTAEIYKKKKPIYEPHLVKDFEVYKPHSFGQYSNKQLYLKDFI